MAMPRCNDCDETMVEGWMLELTYGSREQEQWVEGPPEKGWFGWPKLRGKRSFPVTACRCPKCGRLKLYAMKPAS